MVEHQREDGSFGAPGETFAARGRMLRALCAAYSMSGDKQLLTFMLRYMKYLHDTLRVRSLSAEDAMHTADTMEAGILLYNITGQKAILSVLMMLVSQGADYTSLFHAFPYRTPISRSFTAQELLDALAHEDESGYTHHLLRSASGANLCEGLRVSALCGVLTGSGKHLSAPEAGLARLNKAHGAAGGGVTADPLLGGTHPSRGVSAVSACELAASLETLLACPGGEFGADQLETLMYNTIDAAFSPDGRGVQPMQQANQAMLSRAARFPLCGEDAGLFSLEDGDALCSLLSAWPRFVQAQWMISRDDGLCAMGYAPCSVRYRLSGASVRVDVESDYPASGSVHITVHTDTKAAFPIHLRIPEWANGATVAVDGEILPAQAGGFVTLNRDWQDSDEILLTLPMAVRRLPAFHQAVSVARGPLRFALTRPKPSNTKTRSARKSALPSRSSAERKSAWWNTWTVPSCLPPASRRFRDGACAPPAATSRRLCSATRTSPKPLTRNSCPMRRPSFVWRCCRCCKRKILRFRPPCGNLWLTRLPALNSYFIPLSFTILTFASVKMRMKSVYR